MKFRMKKPVDKSYGIIGLGRFGYALALSLAEAGKEILVIDYDEEHVKEMRNYTENAFVVHKVDRSTLEETGIQNCDVVIVCIGATVDTSILTTLNVIELGVPRVISKASTAEQGKVLEKIGAEVVYPERDMAIRLAHRLVSERLMNYFELQGDINISELSLSEALEGMTVSEADIRKNFGLNIIALERDCEIITEITPNLVFRKEDVIVLLGAQEKIEKFEEFLSN